MLKYRNDSGEVQTVVLLRYLKHMFFLVITNLYEILQMPKDCFPTIVYFDENINTFWDIFSGMLNCFEKGYRLDIRQDKLLHLQRIHCKTKTGIFSFPSI